MKNDKNHIHIYYIFIYLCEKKTFIHFKPLFILYFTILVCVCVCFDSWWSGCMSLSKMGTKNKKRAADSDSKLD